ncbi:hypothetical protein KCP71_02840 [Salmonella enterica subsp. enterica]|nr:hypothetical protein KCP71_02840 [Salmonella enterica subsp. enterica]
MGCRAELLYHWQIRRDDRAITLCIREIAETRIRYGCPPRISYFSCAGKDGLFNHKKTHRIYCLEGLNPRRKRAHIRSSTPSARPVPTHVDQCRRVWIS